MKKIQISSTALAALAEKYKSLNAPAKINILQVPQPEQETITLQVASDKYGNTITYNEKQQMAIDLALKGESDRKSVV